MLNLIKKSRKVSRWTILLPPTTRLCIQYCTPLKQAKNNVTQCSAMFWTFSITNYVMIRFLFFMYCCYMCGQVDLLCKVMTTNVTCNIFKQLLSFMNCYCVFLKVTFSSKSITLQRFNIFFLTFPACFLVRIFFSNLNSNCVKQVQPDKTFSCYYILVIDL